MKKGRMSSAAPLILTSATSARAADGFFSSFVKCGFVSSVSPVVVAFCLEGNVSFPNNVFVFSFSGFTLSHTLFVSAPATPGAGGVTGGVTEKVARDSGVGGDSGGGGQKKGMGKKGKSPRLKLMVSKSWDLYKKMVRPMEHLNRLGNSIGIVIGIGISIYTMVFVKDEDATREMLHFFKKLSKFIRDDDEGLTSLTVSWKEIGGIPVQMEFLIKQNREIIRKLDKMAEEIDRKKEGGHGESEGEGKQNDGDGKGK